MASERQIAANRRNARNSSGPRSSAGKKRASGNSYRHGLTARIAASAEFAKRIERLARKIAGDRTDAMTLEDARTAARAQFDLVRVRQVKVALIETMSAVEEFETQQSSKPAGKNKRLMRGYKQRKATPSEPGEGGGPITAEAVQRALPDLLKLDRYERRAAVLRDRSIQSVLDRNMDDNNQ